MRLWKSRATAWDSEQVRPRFLLPLAASRLQLHPKTQTGELGLPESLCIHISFERLPQHQEAGQLSVALVIANQWLWEAPKHRRVFCRRFCARVCPTI